MPIINTQDIKKSYRQFIFLGAALAAFASAPAVAQSDTATPTFQKISSNYPVIWTNPITHKRLYLDDAWQIDTKYESGEESTVFHNDALNAQIGVLSNYQTAGLREQAAYILGTNGDGQYLIRHSEFLKYKGVVWWSATGTLMNIPGHAFIMYVSKDGSYMRNIIGFYPAQSKPPASQTRIFSQIIDSFAK